jgi:hypothetical protein
MSGLFLFASSGTKLAPNSKLTQRSRNAAPNLGAKLPNSIKICVFYGSSVLVQRQFLNWDV